MWGSDTVLDYDLTQDRSAPCQARFARPLTALLALACALQIAAMLPAMAQSGNIEIRGPIEDVPRLLDIPSGFNTTTVPRTPDAQPPQDGVDANITLRALVVEDTRVLSEGVVWRIFHKETDGAIRPKLIQTLNTPSPTVTLEQGTYFINAAYGRANLTRRITVLSRTNVKYDFVLNAGGLRVDVQIASGRRPMAQEVRVMVYSDESDQAGERELVIADARPGDILRLNAGLYHIESRIGQANAIVRSEVSVEAGKLTIARVTHDAATVTLKLVNRPGGEAIANTRWAILSPSGDVLRESVGALPSHVLAPGRYIVTATVDGRIYRRDFEVATGQNANVEVIAQ